MAQINENTIFNVKNRSSSMVVYNISELGIRREFAPGETKRLPFSELEKLTYQPGGRELLENFLQILDEVVTTNLNVKRDVEYDMSEDDIRRLLLVGSLDAFLDALDFAPVGVIDLIKSYAVRLPLSDLNKRKALKEKTGFDLDAALTHQEEERMEEQQHAAPVQTAQRRVQPAAEPQGRRTTTSYKVVSKTETPAAEEKKE